MLKLTEKTLPMLTGPTGLSDVLMVPGAANAVPAQAARSAKRERIFKVLRFIFFSFLLNSFSFAVPVGAHYERPPDYVVCPWPRRITAAGCRQCRSRRPEIL